MPDRALFYADRLLPSAVYKRGGFDRVGGNLRKIVYEPLCLWAARSLSLLSREPQHHHDDCSQRDDLCRVDNLRRKRRTTHDDLPLLEEEVNTASRGSREAIALGNRSIENLTVLTFDRQGVCHWPMIFACEMKIRGEWTEIGIDAALKSAGEDMRCSRCQGRVFAHKAYSNGTAAHFEHQEAHNGCSLSGYLFEPPAKIHPNPLK